MRTIDALPGKSGRKPIYDYDTLLDGQARVLRRGTKDEVEAGTADFTAKVDSFTSRVSQVAREWGLRFEYRTEGEGIGPDEVGIQAFKVDTDEDDEA